MAGKVFVRKLEASNRPLRAQMELAAAGMPSVADGEIKIALAQQAGDEARPFRLLEQRRACEAATKTLTIAGELRGAAARKLGTPRFPGC